MPVYPFFYFRYCKLVLLYRMYQSAGHSVYKYINIITVKLCFIIPTMALKCRYMAMRWGYVGNSLQMAVKFYYAKKLIEGVII